MYFSGVLLKHSTDVLFNVILVTFCSLYLVFVQVTGNKRYIVIYY